MMEILRGYFADFHPHFWASVVEIIWINVLLSGDNAVVIALACRALPRRQRLAGMVLGTAAAVVLRLAFAGVVSQLMVIPFLKIAGGVALLWIATKLLVHDSNGNGTVTSPSHNLFDAVKAIAIADVVMSLDNVIAVVAAADGNFALIVFGLGLSIPMIVAGATIIMAVLNYVPRHRLGRRRDARMDRGRRDRDRCRCGGIRLVARLRRARSHPVHLLHRWACSERCSPRRCCGRGRRARS